MESRAQKANRTEWTAAFLAAAELVRAGYIVSFTMGNRTPLADLMVWNPKNDEQFVVDVKGWRGIGGGWFAAQKEKHENLFYIFVLVTEKRSEDRFFVLSQEDYRLLHQPYRQDHPEWDGHGEV